MLSVISNDFSLPNNCSLKLLILLKSAKALCVQKRGLFIFSKNK